MVMTFLWRSLEKQPSEVVLDGSLSLSPSRLKQYQDCPRKFLYASLLKLPQPDALAMRRGTLMHHLMEVFHQNPDNDLPTLCRQLFAAPLNPPFDPEQTAWIETLSPYRKQALQQFFEATVADVLRKGLPTEGAVSVATEVPCEFRFPGYPQVQFRMRLDCLAEQADGRWILIDYKVFGPAVLKGKKPETRIQHLAYVLYGLSETATSHAERFHTYKPLWYQLPLYWLALQQHPRYAGRIAGVGLQVLRPVFPQDPAQGSIYVPLPLEWLEGPVEPNGKTTNEHGTEADKSNDPAETDAPTGRETVLADLQRYVIEPLLQATRLEAVNVPTQCNPCAYRTVCPQAT
jgi:hypothetical protein